MKKLIDLTLIKTSNIKKGDILLIQVSQRDWPISEKVRLMEQLKERGIDCIITDTIRTIKIIRKDLTEI